MRPETVALIRQGDAKKGDVLGTARLAGIMAAKRTHELIPLCHPLLLSKVAVDCALDDALPGVRVTAEVKVVGPDRRRDGGADRRLGRLPDDLRHGEGGRPRHAHRGHAAAARRAAAAPACTRPRRHEPDLRSRRRSRRVLASVERPVEAETVPLSAAARAHARRRTSPRCATSRPSPPPPWTATPCAPPMSPRCPPPCA